MRNIFECFSPVNKISISWQRVGVRNRNRKIVNESEKYDVASERDDDD